MLLVMEEKEIETEIEKETEKALLNVTGQMIAGSAAAKTNM